MNSGPVGEARTLGDGSAVGGLVLVLGFRMQEERANQFVCICCVVRRGELKELLTGGYVCICSYGQ